MSDPMQNLNEAADALNQVAARAGGFLDEADQRIMAKEADVTAFLSEAATHYPLIRVSPNQWGAIDAATQNLQGWCKNAGFALTVEIERTITSGIAFAARPVADQEVLLAMGMGEKQHFFPSVINILKMSWSGAMNGPLQYTIYPFAVPVYGWVTIACYSKLVSGVVGGPFFTGATSEWGMTGSTYKASANSYTNPHPYIYSDSGEIHFALPAVALGWRQIDRENPEWSWMPALNGATPGDTTK